MRIVLFIPLFFVDLMRAPAQIREEGQQRGPLHPQEYAVEGTVISVRPEDSTIIIRPFSLLGALRLRAEEYVISDPAVISLLPGDRITASTPRTTVNFTGEES